MAKVDMDSVYPISISNMDQFIETYLRVVKFIHNLNNRELKILAYLYSLVMDGYLKDGVVRQIPDSALSYSGRRMLAELLGITVDSLVVGISNLRKAGLINGKDKLNMSLFPSINRRTGEYNLAFCFKCDTL